MSCYTGSTDSRVTLTQQGYLIVANLIEGDVNTRRLAVYKRKLATNRFPGKSADHLLTLHRVHWYLLLLHVEDLKVVEHALHK